MWSSSTAEFSKLLHLHRQPDQPDYTNGEKYSINHILAQFSNTRRTEKSGDPPDEKYDLGKFHGQRRNAIQDVNFN